MRHHCKEGNLKWISLLLWAGADPLKPGAEHPGEQLTDDDYGLSALGYAALYDHLEVFDLKPVRAKLKTAARPDCLRYLNKREGVNVLKRLLEHGINPNDYDDDNNGGCSLIGSFIQSMSWSFSRYPSWRDNYGTPASERKIDTPDARDNLKAIHLLARHGGKWRPKDKGAINYARRSLLKLTPDYTTEFVWIMSKYKACALETIQSLLSTPTIKSHTVAHAARLREITSGWTK